MARNELFIGAPPQRVYELLADPRSYAFWVVGSHSIRAADEDWPEPGARFHHTVGGPLPLIRDHTMVRASLEPVMIELIARARPLGTAKVLIELTPEGNGTRVLMIEEPASRLLSLLIGPLGHGLVRLRNAESLRRLKRLAEGESPQSRGRLPSTPRSILGTARSR